MHTKTSLKLTGPTSWPSPGPTAGSRTQSRSPLPRRGLRPRTGCRRGRSARSGLPIEVEAHCVGGIGVSGGTGEQDVTVAKAGLAALKR